MNRYHLVLAWIAAYAGLTAADTHYVNVTNPSAQSPYTNWATAAQEIQQAVDAATAGDSVLVTNGVYQAGMAVTPGFTLSNRVVVTTAIRVASVNGPGSTIIAGSTGTWLYGLGPGAVRCAYLSGGAQLEGFTLSNGHTLAAGYASDNQGGGGVAVFAGSTLTNCTVCASTAYQRGGGIVIQGAGVVACCTVAGNIAGATSLDTTYGGGVYLSGGAMLVDTLVADNRATRGGGVFGWSDARVYRCTIVRNVAIDESSGMGFGGGVRGGNGLDLANAVIVSNWAEGGGGVFFDEGIGYQFSSMRNCTVCGNAASNIVGGAGWAGIGEHTLFQNSIIYLNTASSQSNFPDIPLQAYYRLEACCTFPRPYAGRNITNNPGFISEITGDSHLRLDSLCINSGSNSMAALPFDCEGNPRIIGGIVDIGAYEYTGVVARLPPVIDSIVPLDGTATNAASVSMAISLYDDTGISNVTVNGTAATPAGEPLWTFTAVLSPGTNAETVIARDLDNLATTQTVRYIRVQPPEPDSNTPVIVSVAPASGYTTSLSSVQMTMVATDDVGVAAVVVNGVAASYGGSDTWQYLAPLANGTNTKVVIARDAWLNAATQTVEYLADIPPGDATIHHVSLTGSHVPPYTNWADAATNIQDAVDVAVDGHTVLVAPGVYDRGGTPIGTAVSNRVYGTNAIVIRSVAGPDATVIAGAGSTNQPGTTRCVWLQGGAMMVGFTLSNGNAFGSGGLLDVAGGGAFLYISGTLSNCVIVGCHAEEGGGIFCGWYGTVTTCRVVGNTAHIGGGMFMEIEGCYVADTAFLGNSAPDEGTGGGGLYARGSDRNIVRCCFAGNTAGIGGGLSVQDAGVLGCVFCSNSAVRGGGVYGYAMGAYLSSCLVFDNSASEGGGIYGMVNLYNSTVTRNSASNNGGGHYFYMSPLVANTILYGNSAPHGSNVYGHVLGRCSYSCTEPLDGWNLIEQSISFSPQFADFSSGDFHLLGSSPCLDAGTGLYVNYAWDIEGSDRISNGRVDMGAYEFVPEPALAGAMIVLAIVGCGRSNAKAA